MDAIGARESMLQGGCPLDPCEPARYTWNFEVSMKSFCLLLFSCLLASGQGADILWDTWGIPHIFAHDNRSLFKAFGWAQAEGQGDLVLLLYGEARGRAAEYWGPKYLDSDKWVALNGIPERAKKWLAEQPPDFRGDLDAFAAGFNAYAAKYPSAIAPQRRIVLPVTALDVIAHVQRVINFSFVTRQSKAMQLAAHWQPPGSNAWAVAPKRTADGHALLLENPHLPWSDLFRHFEAQLSGPGADMYGATLVGIPVLVQVFNDDLGWAHTVNAYDGQDDYDLTLRKGGYFWNGAVRPFETESHTIKVKTPAGFREVHMLIRRSVQGPVIAQKGDHALALRVAGLDQPGEIREWWDMAHAHDLKQFDAALETLQIPMFTVMYADRFGNILHQYNGRVPMRPPGNYDWAGVVPGDTSATLWTKTLPFADLPRVLDPPSGWLENSNDPPWNTTLPRVLDPSRFPPYLAPLEMSFRAQRSAQLMESETHLTLDRFIHDKYSTRMGLADRILPDLLEAVARYGDADAKRAARVLGAWDRCADASSRGAVLFERFVEAWNRRTKGDMFHTAWSLNAPITTPGGLSDPRQAAATLGAVVKALDREHTPLDIAWGALHRFRGGSIDLAANGGPGELGIFRVVNFAPAPDGKFVAIGGDSYFATIEFSTPLQARAVIAPGNSTQPGSPHRFDQLKLMAEKRMRPVWRTREEIGRHLERKERIQ
jgi:acyl-homoserine-lactone acylase